MGERPRLFVDMDGTLALFQEIDTIETLFEEGYFKNLPPQVAVVNAVNTFLEQSDPEVDVYILSSYLTDSDYALKEKNEWLDRYLPKIKPDHRIFLPCGDKKTDFIPRGIRESDVLFDDYTLNLNDWEPPAIGIKCLNGINHTRGTWQGRRVSIASTSSQLYDKLRDICLNHTQIKDEKPDYNETEYVKPRR